MTQWIWVLLAWSAFAQGGKPAVQAAPPASKATAGKGTATATAAQRSSSPGQATSPAAQTAAPATQPTTQDAMQNSLDQQRAALAQQIDSIRNQAAIAGQSMKPWSPAPVIEPDGGIAEANCDPVADSVLNPIIESAAKAQNLKADVLRAVIEQESAFRACAVSVKGAQGLMQLMPETVTALGVRDPFDPKQNVDAGAKYLKQLLDRYQGDLTLALGAYNAGPATVDQAGGMPNIPETRGYVNKILQKVRP
ncbi:MAG TPA: lytic transglycosylase domain-containing protein [Bryobacteraceae bacterium]|nr:lytic transglycosylase domain-containing protein [Bryobacteraceae bacterium]